MELYVRAAKLGSRDAYSHLGMLYYHDGGNLKKANFHFEAAAMAGCEDARCNLAICEKELGNMERAVKHWMIAASAGSYNAMHQLRQYFKEGTVSRELIDSTLEAYIILVLSEK